MGRSAVAAILLLAVVVRVRCQQTAPVCEPVCQNGGTCVASLRDEEPPYCRCAAGFMGLSCDGTRPQAAGVAGPAPAPSGTTPRLTAAAASQDAVCDPPCRPGGVCVPVLADDHGPYCSYDSAAPPAAQQAVAAAAPAPAQTTAPTCAPPCLNGGRCKATLTGRANDGDNFCDCADTGFAGRSCDTLLAPAAAPPAPAAAPPTCAPPCLNGGRCKATLTGRANDGDNFCDCGDTGFAGRSCDTPLAPAAAPPAPAAAPPTCAPPCLNGGRCKATLTGRANDGDNFCDCADTGFAGRACDAPLAPAAAPPTCAPACQNGGTCGLAGGRATCNCTATGYGGSDCATPLAAGVTYAPRGAPGLARAPPAARSSSTLSSSSVAGAGGGGGSSFPAWAIALVACAGALALVAAVAAGALLWRRRRFGPAWFRFQEHGTAGGAKQTPLATISRV